MCVLQRNEMVDIQPHGVGDCAPGMGTGPSTPLHSTVPVIHKLDPHLRLSDQHFVARALAIVVSVDPVAPRMPIVASRAGIRATCLDSSAWHVRDDSRSAATDESDQGEPATQD